MMNFDDDADDDSSLGPDQYTSPRILTHKSMLSNILIYKTDKILPTTVHKLVNSPNKTTMSCNESLLRVHCTETIVSNEQWSVATPQEFHSTDSQQSVSSSWHVPAVVVHARTPSCAEGNYNTNQHSFTLVFLHAQNVTTTQISTTQISTHLRSYSFMRRM